MRIQFNSGIRAIVILVGELMHTPICADSRMLHKMVKYAQNAVATRFICHWIRSLDSSSWCGPLFFNRYSSSSSSFLRGILDDQSIDKYLLTANIPNWYFVCFLFLLCWIELNLMRWIVVGGKEPFTIFNESAFFSFYINNKSGLLLPKYYSASAFMNFIVTRYIAFNQASSLHEIRTNKCWNVALNSIKVSTLSNQSVYCCRCCCFFRFTYFIRIDWDEIPSDEFRY